MVAISSLALIRSLCIDGQMCQAAVLGFATAASQICRRQDKGLSHDISHMERSRAAVQQCTLASV